MSQRIADLITRFCGSMAFVYFHLSWFIAWIILNLWNPLHRVRFDPYPFGLLTMIVSLEAIFLSTFIMISQNRGTEQDRLRAESTYEISQEVKATLNFMKSHLELQHRVMLQLLDQIVNTEQHQTELVELLQQEMEEQLHA